MQMCKYADGGGRACRAKHNGTQREKYPAPQPSTNYSNMQLCKYANSGAEPAGQSTAVRNVKSTPPSTHY
jgi:hypothetical protein